MKNGQDNEGCFRRQVHYMQRPRCKSVYGMTTEHISESTFPVPHKYFTYSNFFLFLLNGLFFLSQYYFFLNTSFFFKIYIATIYLLHFCLLNEVQTVVLLHAEEINLIHFVSITVTLIFKIYSLTWDTINIIEILDPCTKL